MNNNRIAVRWKDKKGKLCEKIYPALSEADRAQKWLWKNGIKDVELAVIVKIKPKEENEE